MYRQWRMDSNRHDAPLLHELQVITAGDGSGKHDQEQYRSDEISLRTIHPRADAQWSWGVAISVMNLVQNSMTYRLLITTVPIAELATEF